MKNYYAIVLFSLLSTFVGCQKANNIIESNESCANMLYFKSDEELFAELESINKMNDEEKSEWEKSKGFESFGLAADKFYQSIDPSRFRSIDEVKKFVKDNSKYLQLVEEENGELVLETVLGGSPFRYLANDDGIILVDNFLLKIYDNVALSVDKCCYDKIKTATLEEARTFSKVFSSKSMNVNKSLAADEKPCGTVEDRGTTDRERIRLKIQAWNTEGPSVFQGIVTYEARPFNRVLGIWYWCIRTISCNLVMDVNYKNNMGIDTLYQFRYSNLGERAYVLSDQDYFYTGYINPQVSIGYYKCVARQLGCSSDSAYVYSCD